MHYDNENDVLNILLNKKNSDNDPMYDKNISF